jgi:HSP20 family molecular chaperone IbpA
MWAEAVQVIERAERLHRQFFQCTVSGHGPAWEPPVDIFETEVGLIVLVALPGVPPDQVRIEMETGVLRVTGMRPLPPTLRAATIQRLEIPHGRFERRIELPPGVYQADRREFAHGCLAISLRRGGR